MFEVMVQTWSKRRFEKFTTYSYLVVDRSGSPGGKMSENHCSELMGLLIKLAGSLKMLDFVMRCDTFFAKKPQNFQS